MRKCSEFERSLREALGGGESLPSLVFPVPSDEPPTKKTKTESVAASPSCTEIPLTFKDGVLVHNPVSKARVVGMA